MQLLTKINLHLKINTVGDKSSHKFNKYLIKFKTKKDELLQLFMILGSKLTNSMNAIINKNKHTFKNKNSHKYNK